MKSVVKYPGAKWRIADWIVEKLPKHQTYLEPFFGSGAVLFNKAPSPIETINDLDDDVVNLFRVIREKPDLLIRAIEYTPFARAEYYSAFTENEDPIEKARLFLIRCWQGHGFRTVRWKAGWKHDVQGREAAYAMRNWYRLPEWIAETTDRLRTVQIDNRPALDVIRRYNYPNVLIYADPPYLLSTRTGLNYRHEMPDEASHIELLEVLLQHRGSVAISGYDSLLYNEMLYGWEKYSIAAVAEHGKQRTECLWVKRSTENE